MDFNIKSMVIKSDFLNIVHWLKPIRNPSKQIETRTQTFGVRSRFECSDAIKHSLEVVNRSNLFYDRILNIFLFLLSLRVYSFT